MASGEPDRLLVSARRWSIFSVGFCTLGLLVTVAAVVWAFGRSCG